MSVSCCLWQEICFSTGSGLVLSVLFLLRVCLWWVSGNSFVLTFTKEKKRNLFLFFCLLHLPSLRVIIHRFLSGEIRDDNLRPHLILRHAFSDYFHSMHSADSTPGFYMHSCMTYTNHTYWNIVSHNAMHLVWPSIYTAVNEPELI